MSTVIRNKKKELDVSVSEETETKTKKETTNSAVFEFRLLSNKPQNKQLLKLMDLGRIHYNAVLGEALRRLKLVRQDPLYAETVAIPKNSKENKRLRNANFNLLNKKYGFTDYSLQAFGTKCKNDSHFLNQLGAHVLQKLSTRAFRAVQKVAFGKAKKVNFKRKGEFVSLEGKDNNTFLRYSNTYAIIDNLNIPCKIRKNDPYFEHFLKHRIKYCRLITRKIGTQYKFFLQVIFEGLPYKKIKLGEYHTGLDIGPSTIASVNAQEVHLEKFCSGLVDSSKEIKKLQRKASRKLKLANPQNYDEQGAVKKGAKKWIRSRHYLELKDRVANLQRRMGARRKQLHGEMINRIVSRSYKVSSEKLSYKAFQKLYGKSIGSCAPASFNNRLKERITLLGGKYQEINTYKTKLSQTCICGNVKKKTLSERTHHCEYCHTTMQRDIFSAYLTLFVNASNQLNTKKAQKNYSSFEPIMNQCLSELKQLKKVSSHKVIASFGF